MAAAMERTKTPGIFKRGGRYVVVYKVNGRQRKESARPWHRSGDPDATRTIAPPAVGLLATGPPPPVPLTEER